MGVFKRIVIMKESENSCIRFDYFGFILLKESVFFLHRPEERRMQFFHQDIRGAGVKIYNTGEGPAGMLANYPDTFSLQKLFHEADISSANRVDN